MIYASGFSLVIIAARIVAAFWYPAVFCVTWLCIAAYFAIPFAFCLQLARFEKIDKEMLKIILSLFFAFYLSVAWSFSYLYYDIIWLALCAAPSMVVLMPRLIDKDRRFKAFSINGSWSKATVVTILSAFLIWMSGISSTLSVDYVKNIFDPDLLDPWGYIYFILPYLVCIETALLNRLKKNTIIIVLAIFFVLYFAFGFTLPVIRDNWATLIFNSVVSMIIFAMIRMWKTMLVFYAILLIINFMPIVGGALFPDSNQLGKPVFIVSLALATAIQLAIYVSRKKLTKHVEIK